MKKTVSLIALSLILLFNLISCKKEPVNQTSEEPTEQTTTEQVTTNNKESNPLLNVDALNFNKSYPEYKPLDLVTLNSVPYSIESDLSNITNLSQFNFTDEQKKLIAENGFVVIPTESEQLFYIYDKNAYSKTPHFITTDSILHTFHLIFDYSLRTMETDYFYDDLVTLNNNMLTNLISQYENETDEVTKKYLLRTIGYFAVPQLLLEKELPTNFPNEIMDTVNAELANINKLDDNVKSPLYRGAHENPIDDLEVYYSLFKPRGHYTRSETLEKFFRAMSWYGNMPLFIYKLDDDGNIIPEDTAHDTIIIANAFSSLPAEDAFDLWENIYSTTSFYVGESDDLTPFEISKIVNKVYGDNLDLTKINDKLDDFYAEVESTRNPKIVPKLYDQNNTGQQFRFMGQRYILDSEITQRLTKPIQREIPTGFDVFGVLGSERAKEIIDTIYKPQDTWPQYDEEFGILKTEFASKDIPYWTKNLYSTWFYSLKSLLGSYGAGYPLFMQNKAWEDKTLATALGSWSQLRHDTILYGKQSMAQRGGGEPSDNLEYSYVEPNPEFYNRISWLASMMKDSFKARGILSESADYALTEIEKLTTNLKDYSIKILNGEYLTESENNYLIAYGAILEHISLSIVEGGDNWFLIESKTDRNMATIADVHTSSAGYLETAVGTAANIYVVVSQNGINYLTRGGVFDYYEFVSSDDRLTDEQWQEMLVSDPVERPEFTKTFLREGNLDLDQ